MKKFVTLGEVMQRLTPPAHDKLEQCRSLNVTYGGSEVNIAIALANFGHDVRFATVLPDNPLGIAAYRSLRQYGMDLTPTKLKGDILGSYYVEVGYSLRASNVIYNRKYSAIAQMEANTLDIDEVLSDRTHLHVSGITLALGKEIREFTLELVKVAFERGLTISFDFNYRAKLWTVEEASTVIREILPYVHIVFGSLYDIETIGGYRLEQAFESVDAKRKAVFHYFMANSHCQAVFGTVREQQSTHQNCLSAYCYTKTGDVYTTNQTYQFEIIDRVGAGDAFVAGVLNELDLNRQTYQEALNYGLACGVLKHTMNGDVLLTHDQEVKDLMSQTGSVGMKR